MRTILNISLPPAMAEQVKQEVSQGNYASTSEFFRHLIRQWNTQRLAKQLKKDRNAFQADKGKVLTSLKDLR